MFYYGHLETRFRATSRLLNNLRREDAMEEAEENGFPFPTTTNDQLQEALAALLQHAEEEELQEQEVEEKMIVFEWNENYDEQEDM